MTNILTIQAKRLAAEMVAQAKEISDGPMENKSGTDEIPRDLRRTKVEQVMGLLEREYVPRHYHSISSTSYLDVFTDVVCRSALVDAAQERLGRLSLNATS